MTIHTDQGDKYKSFMDDVNDLVSEKLLTQAYPTASDEKLGAQVYTGRNCLLQITDKEDKNGVYYDIKILTNGKAKDARGLGALVKKHR